MARNNPDQYVMRSASSVIAFWAGAAVLLLIVASPLAQADWHLFWFLFAPALLLAWLFWIVLYRPAVKYDSARAVVINIGRTYVLPWGHVTNVRQGLGMVFDLDVGKSVQAWGVPAPRRRGIIGGAIDRRTRPSNDVDHHANILDGVRRSAQPRSEPIASTWDIVPLAIGAVLVVAVVVEFAVGV